MHSQLVDEAIKVLLEDGLITPDQVDEASRVGVERSQATLDALLQTEGVNRRR